MLYSLSISNYILIDSLETRFPEGLVIISGETGAGKSILLGALSLVLGAKADAGMVGPAADRCVVEAVFGMDEHIREILRQGDLPAEEDRLTLRRTVNANGRSRCFANDEPVPVNVLQELSSCLVDIHSQHQTLRLQDGRFRMEALDLQAGAAATHQRCREAWNSLLEAQRSLQEIRQRIARAQAEEDYNRARLQRLEQAKLEEGEQESLEAQQRQLSHAEEIKETLCALENLLGADEGTPSLALREAARLLDKAARFLPSLEELSHRVTSARLELDDIAQEVASVNSRTEASPERLEAVEERLSLLYKLQQSYGAASVEELLQERDRLSTLVRDAGELQESEQQAAQAVQAAEEAHAALCRELSELRSKAAPAFAHAVLEQLQALELSDATFEVLLSPTEAGPDGAESVHFLFSASAGVKAGDVAKSASGGELSRIMLSIKAVMARFTHMPTLVFDEIDTGVSGSTADKMGSLVCRMGQDMQVIAITHLPQVAAKGNAHFLVSKEGGHSQMHRLDREGRIQELSRMLSGSVITPAAKANAESLLNA